MVMTIVSNPPIHVADPQLRHTAYCGRAVNRVRVGRPATVTCVICDKELRRRAVSEINMERITDLDLSLSEAKQVIGYLTDVPGMTGALDMIERQRTANQM